MFFTKHHPPLYHIFPKPQGLAQEAVGLGGTETGLPAGKRVQPLEGAGKRVQPLEGTMGTDSAGQKS